MKFAKSASGNMTIQILIILIKRSEPNHMTLKEGRKNFLKYGACEEKFITMVLSKDDCRKHKFSIRNL